MPYNVSKNSQQLRVRMLYDALMQGQKDAEIDNSYGFVIGHWSLGIEDFFSCSLFTPPSPTLPCLPCPVSPLAVKFFHRSCHLPFFAQISRLNFYHASEHIHTAGKTISTWIIGCKLNGCDFVEWQILGDVEIW